MKAKTIDRTADMNKSLPSLSKSTNENEYYSTTQNIKDLRKSKTNV